MSFFLLFAGLFGGYIGWRLVATAGLGIRYAFGTSLLVVALLFTSPVTVIMRINGLENLWLDRLTWLAYLGLGFLSFIFTFLIIRDAGWTGLGLIRRAKRMGISRNPLPARKTGPDGVRRHMLIKGVNIGIMASAGIFTGYGVAAARQVPEVRRIRVPVEGLHSDLKGFRIVQITDIHVSPTIKRPFVAGVVDVVNGLSADLVALTGDLVDGSVVNLSYDVAPIENIKSKYGNYFVTGNHEYYSGVTAWMRHVEKLGFTVLLNEHRLVEKGRGRLVLAGVPDYRGGQFLKSHRSDPVRALAGAPSCHAKILLAHQPKSFPAAVKAGYDLQISGHTHGGQFFPWNFFVQIDQPYVAGLYRHRNSWVYVSRGTGYWGPPVRLGSPSEITVIELV
ncbi:MAG: metallophosphoesterase [Deltaproteobacteria bacterium]|nr:metallophosphoesterase [Deltaproteobacteria bacterium]